MSCETCKSWQRDHQDMSEFLSATTHTPEPHWGTCVHEHRLMFAEIPTPMPGIGALHTHARFGCVHFVQLEASHA